MPSRRGMLTLEQLATQVEDGSIDTVLVAFTDMQGRLAGKRCAADYFLDEVAPHAAEACNYLLAVDVEMNTVDGYAMSSWERGYGDFVLRPDLTTLRMVPWHEATALVLCDVEWADGAPVGAVAAADPRAPARPARRARARRRRRHRAGVHAVHRLLRRGVAEGLPRPAARQPLQRRLLDARHRARRAGAAAHPQRDGGRGDGGRVGQGRVQPRPARDRLPLRRGAHHVRQPLDLQDRRQGDRRPGRDGADVHGEVRRAGGQLLPHPHLAARQRRRRRERVPRRRAARLLAALRPLPRRSAGVPARADLPVRAERQLLQAVRRGQLRPDGRRLGHGQPHLLAAGRRARRRAAGGEPRAGRGRQPVPRGGGADRGRAARHRAGAAAAAGADGQRLRRRRPAGAVAPCATRPSCSPPPRWRPRRSARRSSSTTPTPPAWSSPRSTRPSPTGSGGAGSSACDAADRDHRVRGAGRVGRVGARGGAAPPHLHRRGDRGGRAPGAAGAAGGVGRGRRPARRAWCSRAAPTSTRPATAPRPTRAPALPRTDRDAAELAVLARALELGRPVLAVCRGLQVLNVALGGTLVQHLPGRVGHTGHNPRPGVFGRTDIALGRGIARWRRRWAPG